MNIIIDADASNVGVRAVGKSRRILQQDFIEVGKKLLCNQTGVVGTSHSNQTIPYMFAGANVSPLYW